MLLLPLTLFPALSLIAPVAASDLDDFPCPIDFPLHQTTVSSSGTSCRKVDDPFGQYVESKRVKRQQEQRQRMSGCGNEQLRQIMEHVLLPLLARNELRIGDIAQILQQSVQRATGKSFEVLMGRSELGISSRQMDPSAACTIVAGGYHTTVYETPVQYNINDEQEEQWLSNVDFGERLGGSGYRGQLPWLRIDPLEAGLINLAGFVQMECFSGDLLVETIEGPRRMRELKTGDQVMSVEGDVITFSPIIMFLHREEQLLAEFNIITTANGDKVKLTNEHLIYVSNCDPKSVPRLVRAKEVTTDHCLIATRSPVKGLNDDRVLSITKTYEEGIYAPLTLTGDIFVNNVLSSCHSNLGVKTLQDSLFSVYRAFAFILPEEGALPLGLASLASAIDFFIPSKLS